MKLELEQIDVDRIADRVIEKLLPYLEDMKQEDKILSIDQVAILLGKSKGQIYQWVSDAKHGLSDFPYLKAGRSLRFSKKDIARWMKSDSKRLESR